MKYLFIILTVTLISCKKNPFDPNEPEDGMDTTFNKVNKPIIRDTLHRTNCGAFGKYL